MKTKRLIGLVALTLTTTLTMGFMTYRTTNTEKKQIEFIQLDSGEWAGQVWVEAITQGQPGREVTHWHLMATNTTGQGHCISGFIKDNGEKIPVCAYVSARASKREKAESIFSLNHSFTVVQHSFEAVDAKYCL